MEMDQNAVRLVKVNVDPTLRIYGYCTGCVVFKGMDSPMTVLDAALILGIEYWAKTSMSPPFFSHALERMSASGC